MEQIGIRELRQHASRWLERVRQGESFEVTDRGRAVALLVPTRPSSRYDELVASGEIVQATADLRLVEPLPATDGPTGSERLAAMREHER